MLSDDFLVSSNNSANDNRINAKRARSKVHQLKQLLRPVLALLRTHKKNSYKKNRQVVDDEDEIGQNDANELLEARLCEEIDECDDFAAVPVYADGHLDLMQVFRGQRYIPVHFARTQAGTFFWTSIVGADCDLASEGDQNRITEFQKPEVQSDRWAQA